MVILFFFNKLYYDENFKLSQKFVEEYVDFTQVLTNCAMGHGGISITKATRRLSIALSKEWIVQAYNDVTMENRSKVPVNIDIQIEDWNGITQNGSNEEDLLNDLIGHLKEKETYEIYNTKLKFRNYIKVLFGLYAIFMASKTSFFVGAAFITWFFLDYRRIGKKKLLIKDKYNHLINNGTAILKAVLAEVVDIRREYEKEDSKQKYTFEYINSLDTTQYIYSKNRNVII